MLNQVLSECNEHFIAFNNFKNYKRYIELDVWVMLIYSENA